jgi:hypothetical protein
VQIGRGRGGFYTYTAIERLLAADIDNLDRIDPNPQTLKPGERIWMTPERYLSHLPGQFWAGTPGEPGRALVLERKTAREPAASHLVVGGAASSRRHDPTAGPAPRRPRPGISGSLSETFWLVGTFLMECGMLRGIKARAEQSLRAADLARTDLPHFRAGTRAQSRCDGGRLQLTARHHMIVDPLAERRHEQQNQHRDSADSVD